MKTRPWSTTLSLLVTALAMFFGEQAFAARPSTQKNPTEGKPKTCAEKCSETFKAQTDALADLKRSCQLFGYEFWECQKWHDCRNYDVRYENGQCNLNCSTETLATTPDTEEYRAYIENVKFWMAVTRRDMRQMMYDKEEYCGPAHETVPLNPIAWDFSLPIGF